MFLWDVLLKIDKFESQDSHLIMRVLEVGVMKLQLDLQELPLHKYEEVLSTSFYSTALDSSRGSLSDFRTSMNPPK
jgi:hypothetical protein